MKKILVAISLALASSLVVNGQSTHGIWVIDYVKIKPGKEKEALYFYGQNWLAFRENAKKEGFIKSYQLIHIKRQDNPSFDLMLMTEFADSTKFKAMEENFRGVMSKTRPNGPLFLNELRPKEFMEFVNSAEATSVIQRQH
jgi:hypothetical protein